MDTLSIEQFEKIVGKALTAAIQKLMSLTGADSQAETNVKMTVIYQRLAQQLGMVEQYIIEKSVEETGTTHGKVRKMLDGIRIKAEAEGKAWSKDKFDEMKEVNEPKLVIKPGEMN